MMDSDKLEKIRAAARKTDFNDQRLNELRDRHRGEGGESEGHIAPYMGYSTFLKAPQSTDLDTADVALVGVSSPLTWILLTLPWWASPLTLA